MTEPVNTPSYSELVAAVRREGEQLLAAAGQGLDEWVPSCEEWNVEALVEHVASVYNNVVQLVTRRLTTPNWDKDPVPDGEPLEVLRDLLDDLVEGLGECDPDTPVWNWASGSDDVAAFWARRMAHESSVHRFDAQVAHGIAQPIDAELAADGLDELIDVIGPRVYRREKITDGPVGVVALESSDNGTWYVELRADGLARRDVVSEPAAVVRGTTSGLLLAAYGRIPWTTQDVSGDVDLLDAWSAQMHF